MQDPTLADTDYPDFSIFTFKVNCAFIEEKDNHVEKVDEGEVTRNINRKKPDVLQTYKCPLCDTFQVSMIFLVDRLEILLPDEISRYRLDLILGKHGRNCCTKANLRCINSSVNEMF